MKDKMHPTTEKELRKLIIIDLHNRGLSEIDAVHAKQKYQAFITSKFTDNRILEEEWRKALPDFMDKKFPKGDKCRGAVTTGICLFLQSLLNKK